MMRARDMFFDFLDTIFLIALILFFIFYVFIGGRMELVEQIIKTGVVVSIFIIIVMIKLKVSRREKEIMERNEMIEEVKNYIEKKDIIKDQLVITAAALFIPILPVFVEEINKIDVLQSFLVFVYMNLWHLYLFRAREVAGQIRFVTKGDEIADRIIILILPVILLSLTLLGEGANIIDFIQVAFIYFIFYFWHRFIFPHSPLD